MAGVLIGGGRPWDIRVHDERLYGRVARSGMVGLGDAYVDGWWDCQALDQLFERCLRADLVRSLARTPGMLLQYLNEKLRNLQTRRRAFRNGARHYDLGNDLFRAMLDRRMIYSCGCWAGADDLDEAQEAKLDLVCRKLGLERGHRVLDIGCGWGGFAQYAAQRYGCHVVGITVSEQQIAEARRRCYGLDVDIRLQDYRDVDETFDRIVSIGMFEHVGPKNHRACLETIDRCLEPEGLALLHFFATRRTWPNLADTEVTWVTRRVFPGVSVPSLKQFGGAIDGLFVVEDLQNFGADYDPTLLAWFDRFDRHWPRLRATHGDRFYRLWKFYLLLCAGAFRSRKYFVWQIVLSKQGVRGGYARPAPASSSVIETTGKHVERSVT